MSVQTTLGDVNITVLELHNRRYKRRCDVKSCKPNLASYAIIRPDNINTYRCRTHMRDEWLDLIE